MNLVATHSALIGLALFDEIFSGVEPEEVDGDLGSGFLGRSGCSRDRCWAVKSDQVLGIVVAAADGTDQVRLF